MTGWMTLWTILIIAGGVGMIGLLLGVSVGAVRELKETLAELSGDARDATATETES